MVGGADDWIGKFRKVDCGRTFLRRLEGTLPFRKRDAPLYLLCGLSIPFWLSRRVQFEAKPAAQAAVRTSDKEAVYPVGSGEDKIDGVAVRVSVSSPRLEDLASSLLSVVRHWRPSRMCTCW